MGIKTVNAKEINGILNAIEQSDVEEVSIEQPNISIHIVRDMSKQSAVKKSEGNSEAKLSSTTENKVSSTTNTTKESANILTKASENDIAHKDVLSPEVGIFLRAAKENDRMLVKLRDEVKKGQTLAYVRATGIMYEVKSDYDGKVTEILVEDGQVIEFAQPLFRLK